MRGGFAYVCAGASTSGSLELELQAVVSHPR